MTTRLEAVRAAGIVCCCDFCDTLLQCDAHLAAMKAQYDVFAARVDIPVGWTVVPFGEEIPQRHREYDFHKNRWLHERRCHSTMTPMWAKPRGYVGLYAHPTP